MEDVLAGEIDSYLEKNWESIVADIERVVRIESTEDLPVAKPGAPFGPGPRAALTEALDIARGMGFEVHDVDGYVGYADLPGESDTQIGIIGHVDVVPAGPGWTVEPFAVTRREGYLMGRGVIDDKGPIVTTLHAVKFWLDKGEKLPYTIRVIFGANEETGMHDVPYYRERFADPAFLFTPDAEFPVSYGEKGLYDATLTSKRFEDGAIIDIEGGAAPNAVPGIAHAVVRADASTLPAAEGIVVADAGEGTARIDAQGKAAHASLPHLGKSAIDLLVAYLLENDVCSVDERAFFELVRKLTSATDGSNLARKLVPEARVELARRETTVFETAASAIPPLGHISLHSITEARIRVYEKIAPVCSARLHLPFANRAIAVCSRAARWGKVGAIATRPRRLPRGRRSCGRDRFVSREELGKHRRGHRARRAHREYGGFAGGKTRRTVRPRSPSRSH